jgi:hypothetical protein
VLEKEKIPDCGSAGGEKTFRAAPRKEQFCRWTLDKCCLLLQEVWMSLPEHADAVCHCYSCVACD